MTDQTDQGARPAPGRVPGRPERRALLKGAAAAGVVVPFLVACGSSSDGGSGVGSLHQPSKGGSSSGGGNGGNNGGGNNAGNNGQAAGGGSSADVLTTTSDVPTGGGVILDSDGIVITQPTAGEFKGFTNICTHMGCPVSNISGGTINCLCHGSQFSISDGSVVGGPAPSPLAEKPIEVAGKNIVAG